MAEHETQDDQPQPPPRPPLRRSYTTPRLTEYGPVAKLTRGNLSVGSDFPYSGFMNPRCL